MMNDYQDYDDFTETEGTQLQSVRQGEPTWVNGYGKEVPVRSMTTSHIINAVMLLGRKRNDLMWVVEEVNYLDTDIIDRQLEVWRESVVMLLDELDRRHAAKRAKNV